MARPNPEQSPSHILNQAFTGLLNAYDDQVTPSSLRERKQLSLVVAKQTAIDRFTDQFPDIYATASMVYTMPLEMRRNLSVDFVVPVGEYGQRWAQRLFNGAYKLQAESTKLESNGDRFARVAKENAETIQQYTFRGTISTANSVAKTHREGIGSELYAAALLTMYQVDGYKYSPMRLLKDLTEDGVVSDLSLTIPPGVMGEMVYHGTVLANPVVERDATRWRLRRSIIDHWSRMKEFDAYAESAGAKPLERPGCPLGRVLPGESISGVDKASRQLVEHASGRRIDWRERKVKAQPSAPIEMYQEEPVLGEDADKSIAFHETVWKMFSGGQKNMSDKSK